VEPITLPVVHGDVVAKDLGTSVGTARVKGRGLALGRRGAAEHLARRRLVEAALDTGAPGGFQEAECADGDDVGGKLGDLETYLDVALGPEVVDLVGTQVVEQRGERTAVGEVGVVEEEARSGLVDVLIDVVEPVGVQAGGTAFQAVDLVALGKKELSEVRTVLAGSAGDESAFHRVNLNARSVREAVG